MWQSHPATSSGHRGPCQWQLLTAVDAARSGVVGVGQVGKEIPGREEKQLPLRGSCCPSMHRSKQGQCKPDPLRDTKHPCASSPPLNTPQARFTLEHPSWMGCDFSPGLHVKLQITFFIPFPRLLWLLASASNSHPHPFCHPSIASVPSPTAIPVPGTADSLRLHSSQQGCGSKLPFTCTEPCTLLPGREAGASAHQSPAPQHPTSCRRE